MAIQLLRAEGCQHDKIHRPMYAVYGEECVLSNSGLPKYFVNRWAATTDTQWLGWYHTVTNLDNNAWVKSAVLCAWTDRISTAHENICYHGYHTMCSQWVPHLMTDTHKEHCMSILLEHSQQYIADDMFLRWIVGGNETSCYKFEPRGREAGMQWQHTTSSWLKKCE